MVCCARTGLLAAGTHLACTDQCGSLARQLFGFTPPHLKEGNIKVFITHSESSERKKENSR
jgi:hypothetical protein